MSKNKDSAGAMIEARMKKHDAELVRAQNSGKMTPGPWRAVTDAQGICMIMHPRKKGVAVACLSSTFSPVNGYVGSKNAKLGRPERQANAKAILALHDLTKALKRVIPFVKVHYERTWSASCGDALDCATEALKKAGIK